MFNEYRHISKLIPRFTRTHLSLPLSLSFFLSKYVRKNWYNGNQRYNLGGSNFEWGLMMQMLISVVTFIQGKIKIELNIINACCFNVFEEKKRAIIAQTNLSVFQEDTHAKCENLVSIWNIFRMRRAADVIIITHKTHNAWNTNESLVFPTMCC